MTTAQQSVMYSPRALAVLRRGFDTLAAPLALTLGPTQGVIVNERNKGEPEILTDSSTIARRVIQLPQRGSNLGAMMLRNMTLELHDRFGDGAATATVMARAMLRDGARMIAAGANPVLMMQGAERAVKVVERALAAQAQPIRGQEELISLATSVTGDLALGEVLGQMFDILGEHATVITQEIPAPYLDHEYIKGGKWDGYIPAHTLIPEGNEGLILHHPLVFLADEDLKTLEQVQPMLEQALAAPDKPPLLVLARNISDTALATLITNHVRGVLTIGLMVLSSGLTLIHEDLSDIAVITGGEVISEVTGRRPETMQPGFFGRAGRVSLTRKGVVIVDGAGEKQAIRQRIAEVRAELKRVSRANDTDWERLRMRLARLSGGIGVLKLGAYSEQEREVKKEQVQKALRALEAAYDGGVVPGGGAAFLACIPALQEAREACQHADEIYGVSAVESALKAPFLQIVRNYGKIHPPLALAEVERSGPGYGFDALHGDVACMAERHILDSLSVTRGVLNAAVSVAAMIMTTDAIVFTS
jgi:chaperonin GroEL